MLQEAFLPALVTSFFLLEWSKIYLLLHVRPQKWMKYCNFHSNTWWILFLLQIPDVRTGNDIIDAVVVDDEAVGSDGHEFGAKILYGKGALDCYLSQHKLKETETPMEGSSDGEAEAEAEIPSIVASM